MGKDLQEKRWIDVVRGCLTYRPEERKSALDILNYMDKYQFYFENKR